MAKIAIVGKGGAGKTMVASTLAYLFAGAGETVYAIDADPNPTLGMALGFSEKDLETIIPVRSLRQLIAERTGTGGGAIGSFFRLNPRVDDLPERFCGVHRSIRLMVMGATVESGGGCACAENTLIKALVNHLVLGARETVLLDMVAGTEHLGRGTALGGDVMLLVVEPAARSISAGRSVLSLLETSGAGEKCRIVMNKVHSSDDEARIRNTFPGVPVAAVIGWHDGVRTAENEGVPVFDHVPEVVRCLQPLVKTCAAGS